MKSTLLSNLLNKTKPALLAMVMGLGITIEANSQCTPIPAAVPGISLAYVQTGGTNATGVAFNPTFNVYYAAIAGNPGFPLETFDAAGTPLFQTNTGFDMRGLWWNVNTNQLESNGFNAFGIWSYDINGAGHALNTGTQIFTGMNQPTVQSVGDYDCTDNEILYYDNGTIMRRDYATNALVGTINITGLPVGLGNLNNNSIFYTGCPGLEIGLLDYINKAVYFIDKATGAYAGMSQLPAATVTNNAFRASWANGLVWVYDVGPRTWYSFDVLQGAATAGATPSNIFGNDTTLCTGQNLLLDATVAGATYLWHDMSTNATFNVTGPGTYYVDVFVSTCLTMTDTIVVTSAPAADATISAAGPFCESNAAAALAAVDPGGTWSGTGITDAVNGIFDPLVAGPGNHVITYTIAGACGNTDTETITVLPDGDATITPAGPFCTTDPVFTMAAVDNGGTWSATCGGCINAATGDFDPATAGNGSWTITYTIPGACGSTDTENVLVTGQQDATITPVGPFCENDPVITMTAVDPGGTWTATCGGCVNAATGDFDPAVAGAGSHTVTYTLAGNCGDVQNTVVDVNPSLSAAITPAGPFCLGNPSTFLVAVDAGGTWTGNGIVDAVNGEFDPSIAGSGTHIITYTIPGACGDQETTTIVVNDQLTVTALADQTICEGGSASIAALASGGDGNYVYAWTDGAMNPVGNGQNITVSPVTTTTYTVTLGDGCGSTPPTSSVTITVEPLPTINFNADQISGCPPLDVNFTEISAPAGTICLWDFGDTFTSTNCGATSHTYTASGCYDVTLTVTTGAGCTSTLTQPNMVCVTPDAQAAFSFDPPQTTVYDPVFNFTNNSTGATNYEWTFGDGSNMSTEVDPTHQYNGVAGIFQVCLVAANADGCNDTTCQFVEILEEFTVFVPNTFTPNGDGINDVFIPIVNGHDVTKEYEFTVFDRWGQIMFEATSPSNGWGGQDPRGFAAKDDVYVWKLRVTNGVDGGKKEYIGHVTLLK